MMEKKEKEKEKEKEREKEKPSAGHPTQSFPTAANIPVPVSGLDVDRPHHRSSKVKSFSQPLGLPSAALKKKQASLDFPIATATTASHANPSPSSDPEHAPGPLPEFTGAGGGTGIFKLPVRAPMHPSRPPPLELRPHPLRETQVGSFLRSIACTPTQLWAAAECGVRYWDLSRLFGKHGENAEVRIGDEETAPFRESARTSPTLCLVVDDRRGIIWTGHKDGKIRSWRTEKESGGGGEGEETAAVTAFFKEGLSWHAHRCPILSLVVTSNGK